MSKIVAVGGGDWQNLETLDINREIKNLAKNPENALLIPTAMEDSEEYQENFKKLYRDELGLETDSLLLYSDPSEEEINRKFEWADIIYVSGGNTKEMMNKWKETGVNEKLRKAYNEEKLLSGLSAGAICWFEYGHSDSESYETEDSEWSFIRVEGLNIIEDILYCPHYHSEDREEGFRKMIKENPEKLGLAVNDHAAAKIVDGELEIIKSGDEGKAYTVKSINGEVHKSELKTGEKYNLDRLRET
ncbi:MAG: peptidase E [Candidatus Nanohaloarchaea archaeon]